MPSVAARHSASQPKSKRPKVTEAAPSSAAAAHALQHESQPTAKPARQHTVAGGTVQFDPRLKGAYARMNSK
jgi:hypothetical protein